MTKQAGDCQGKRDTTISNSCGWTFYSFGKPKPCEHHGCRSFIRMGTTELSAKTSGTLGLACGYRVED